MMKIFKNTTKLLILGSFVFSQVKAQTSGWGSYLQPIPDSSFQVLIAQGVILKVDSVSYDSLVWQTNLGTKVGSQLVASTDLSGRVLMKKNAKWTFKNVSFNGIKKVGDSLITVNIPDAVYSWTRNGTPLNTAANKLNVSKAPGTYLVSINVPFLSENVAYSFKVEGGPLPGTKIEASIRDSSILGQDLNRFEVSTPADSIVWEIFGTKNYNQSRNYFAFSNVSGSVYVKNAGVWRYANFGFEGFSLVGNLLISNVISTNNAAYKWYKDGVEISGATSGSVAFSGTGNYRLDVSWTPDTTFPGGNGKYEKRISTTYDPLEIPDLIVRSGNTFSINSRYAPDSIKWAYYAYTLPVAGPDLRSGNSVITVDYDAVISVLVYQNKNVYTLKKIYYKIYGPEEKGSYNNPIDSIFVVKSGTELAINPAIRVDTSKWTLTDLATGNITTSTSHYLNLYKDTDVSVTIKTNGKWLKQVVLFRGILYDSVSALLQAPIIKDALYIWYLNDQSTGVTSSSYIPTEPGTYKVLVTWVEAGSNPKGRVEAETKTATYTFVVTAKMLTGLNDYTGTISAETLIYPNPAADFVSLANLAGSFAYNICSVSGSEVLRGQATADSKIDISSLEPGVYLMNIKTQVSQITKRIIVK